MIEVERFTPLLDVAVADHQGRRASSRGSRAKPIWVAAGMRVGAAYARTAISLTAKD
jgi:hypothetical protein